MIITGATLNERQNSEGGLQLLAANSQLYGNGKKVLAVQMFLTVGLAIILPVIANRYPGAKPVVTLIAITVTWLDVLAIDRLQIHFRKQGALGQEQFDCKLFGIDWNEIRCGKPLSSETISSNSQSFFKRHTAQRLKNWYPSDLDQLPYGVSAIACQRLSLGWESGQRQWFGWALIGISGLLVIAIAFWATCCAQTVKEALLVTYASVAPAIIWCAREGRRHLDAFGSTEKTKAFVEKQWQETLSGKLNGPDLIGKVRQIQDAMFDNRSKSPVVFNWFYRLLRTGRENAMQMTAADLISNWKAHGHDF